MAHMKKLWVWVLLLLPGMLLAQKVDRKVYDFGSVELWNNPPATFIITNNTKADMVFLPSFPAKDVLVQLPQGAIKPGASVEVKVQYYTEKKGSFNRTVILYTSNSGTPMELTVKGDIRSFANGALTTCPTVGPKSDEDKMYSQEFQVIDSITKKPIEGATVKILSPEINTIQGRTDKGGLYITRVFVGFYQVEVSASGYNTFYVRGNLAPHQGRIVFELGKPIYVEEPVIALSPAPTLPPSNPTPAPTVEEPWIIDPEEEAPTPAPPAPNPTPAPAPTTAPTSDFTAEGSLGSHFKPNNIVFVLDVSSSMRSSTKLPKLKESMKELVSVLRDVDKVTIIIFSKEATVHVPTTAASNKEYIYAMIDSMRTISYTNGTKGIMMGYDLAQQNFIQGGNNQLIVSTDGEFNNPSFDANVLLGDIKRHTEKGIILSVVGFGDIPEGKKLMRRMANSGKGNYIHFGQGDTKRALVDEIRTQSFSSGR